MKITVELEHSIQPKIQAELLKHHCTVFRANIGKMRTPGRRLFSTGLPSGYPDLSGSRRINGKAFFVGAKNATDKSREDQIRSHHMLMSRDTIHGTAKLIDDAWMIVEGGLCGYGFDD